MTSVYLTLLHRCVIDAATHAQQLTVLQLALLHLLRPPIEIVDTAVTDRHNRCNSPNRRPQPPQPQLAATEARCGIMGAPTCVGRCIWRVAGQDT